MNLEEQIRSAGGHLKKRNIEYILKDVKDGHVLTTCIDSRECDIFSNELIRVLINGKTFSIKKARFFTSKGYPEHPTLLEALKYYSDQIVIDGHSFHRESEGDSNYYFEIHINEPFLIGVEKSGKLVMCDPVLNRKVFNYRFIR